MPEHSIKLNPPRVDAVLMLDRAANALYGARGMLFDPTARRWTSAPPPYPREPCESPRLTPLTLAEAVRWLQCESRAPLRVPIGVIGPRDATSKQLTVAEQLGAGLATRGYTVICGGREGVMAAVCRGVAAHEGIAIGLLPDADPALANPHASIAIATGLGEARNAIIARASFCLVAVGDSLGTLSEVALGLHFGKRVFGLEGSTALAGVELMADVAAALAAVDQLALALPAVGPDGA